MKWSNFFFSFTSPIALDIDIVGDKAAQGKALEVDYL